MMQRLTDTEFEAVRDFIRHHRRRQRLMVAAFFVLVVASTASLYWVNALSKARADDNARNAQRIQDQRKVSTHDGCVDQNHRHDATISRIRVLVRRAHKPASAAAPSITLIDALAPRQDCDRLVRERVTAPPAANPHK
jgi:hypothetical protein